MEVRGRNRWAHPIFVDAAVRDQLNAPKELMQIQRGCFQPRSEQGGFALAMAQLHEHCRSTLGPNHFQDVVDWVGDNIEALQLAYPCLEREHVQALRAFTVERPTAYYRALSELFYPLPNGEASPDLRWWQEFLYWFDDGLDRLCKQQRERAERVDNLVRVCWLPTDYLERLYQPGTTVIFKAPMSTSETVQWEFLLLNCHEHNANSKVPVILHFDSSLTRQAARVYDHISAFPAEREHIFRARLRAQITARSVEYPLPSGIAITNVYLTALPESRPLPRVLNHDLTSSADVLTVAGLLGLHMDPSTGAALLDPLQRIETALNYCVDAREMHTGWLSRLAEAWHLLRQGEEITATEWPELAPCVKSVRSCKRSAKISVYVGMGSLALALSAVLGIDYIASFTPWRTISLEKNLDAAYTVSPSITFALHAGMRLGHVSMISSALSGVLSSAAGVFHGVRCLASAVSSSRVDHAATDQERERREAVAEAVVRLGYDGPARLVESVVREDALQQAPRDLLRPHSSSGAAYQQHVSSGHAHQRDNESIGDAESREVASLALLVNFLIGSRVTGLLLDDGVEEVAQAFVSPFPLDGHHVNIALEVGDRVFEDLTLETDKETAARQAVAIADLLRLRLSRVRILLPMGGPDAGKSTLLKKVYAVNVQAGLSSGSRTATLSLHQHPAHDPDYLPAYVMDVPGCGAKLRARRDVVRLAVFLASHDSFAGMVSPLFLVKAGRPLESDTLAVARAVADAQCPVHYVVTHADKRFQERIEDADRLHEESRDPYWNTEDSAVIDRIAAEIRAEVREHLGQEPLFYACFDGWAAAPQAPASGARQRRCAREPYDGARVDMQRCFDLKSPEEARQILDGMMGLLT